MLYYAKIIYAVLRKNGVAGWPVRLWPVAHAFYLQRTSAEEEALSVIRELSASLGLSQDYRSGGSMLEAYAPTLVTGVYSETYVHPLLDLYSKIDCIRVIVKSLISGTSNQQLTFSDRETRCLGSMITSLINRVFFTTRTRYIVIAPRSTAPGDEVCVILGCNTAMILRPTTDESQKRVVGPCYIKGFSHGEAVLGPLPSGVKRKLLYKGGSYRYIFGDGELLDPRLKDWIDEADQRDIINGITGSGYNRHWVKVGLDDLIQRGIRDARYLDLV